MKTESKVLLIILTIIGIGMINSLFFQPPPPTPEEIAKQEAAEKAAYISNKEHCAKNGLIYIMENSNHGRCMTLSEANAIIQEHEKYLEKEKIKNINAGLK